MMKKSIVIVLFIIGLLLTACSSDKVLGDYVVFQQADSLKIKFLENDSELVVSDEYTDQQAYFDHYSQLIFRSLDNQRLVYPVFVEYGLGSYYVFDVNKKANTLIDSNIMSYYFHTDMSCQKFVYVKQDDQGQSLYFSDLKESTLISSTFEHLIAYNEELTRVLYLDDAQMVNLYDVTSKTNKVSIAHNQLFAWSDDLSIIYHEEFGDVVINKDGQTKRFIYQVDSNNLDYGSYGPRFYKGTMNIPGVTLDQIIEDDAYQTDANLKQPDMNQYTDINQYFYDEYIYSTIGERNIVRDKMSNMAEARRTMYFILGVGGSYDYLSTEYLSEMFLYPNEKIDDGQVLIVGRPYTIDVEKYGRVKLSNIFDSSDFYLAKDIALHYQDESMISVQINNLETQITSYLNIPVTEVDTGSFRWGTLNKTFYYIENQDESYNGDLVKITVDGDTYQRDVVASDVYQVEVIGDEDDILISRMIDADAWVQEVYFKDQLLGNSVYNYIKDTFAFDHVTDYLAFIDETGTLNLYDGNTVAPVTSDAALIYSLSNSVLVYQDYQGSLWKYVAGEAKLLAENVGNAYLLR